MKVYIFRHGLASFGKGAEDPGLNEDGVRDVNKVVKLCGSSFEFAADVIASSPLVRAKETAELARKLLRSNNEVVVDDCLYGDRKPKQVYEFLSKYRKNDKIVLVSHMPLIFELLHDLIGAKADVDLLNGSIACIECDGKASKGNGKLMWLVPPLSSAA
jgi:phosphohistidine phosphatase